MSLLVVSHITQLYTVLCHHCITFFFHLLKRSTMLIHLNFQKHYLIAYRSFTIFFTFHRILIMQNKSECDPPFQCKMLVGKYWYISHIYIKLDLNYATLKFCSDMQNITWGIVNCQCSGILNFWEYWCFIPYETTPIYMCYQDVGKVGQWPIQVVKGAIFGQHCINDAACQWLVADQLQYK